MNQNKDQKLKIVVFSLILITLIILVNLFRNNMNNDNIWNYSEITSATDVISEGIVVNDRKMYYILEDIVVRFLLANDSEAVDNLNSNNIGYEASYKDYYSILTKQYKQYLSKGKFEDKAEKFINKFITVSAEGYKYVNTTNIILAIYSYNNDKYLCVLNGNDGFAYLGVELDTDNTSYNIFYIE